MTDDAITVGLGGADQERLQAEADRTGATPDQVVRAAVRLFLTLPENARASLASLDRFATPEERARALYEVAKTLLAADLAVTVRRLREELGRYIPANVTDDDLARIADQLVHRDPA